MWIYIVTVLGKLWTVGFYDPDGNFIAESDFSTQTRARARVNFLNGGSSDS